MVAYHHYLSLSQSADSEARGQAAHLAALAYLGHDGPADEQAALYAAVMTFLDDPSVKVRAALAYGLLHSPRAPRPVILALAQDAPVISRAVVQFSPVLLNADLMGIVRSGDPEMLAVVTVRPTLSIRVAHGLLALEDEDLTIRVLERHDLALDPLRLAALAERWNGAARVRGALLARKDLPAAARLHLVHAVRAALMGTRIVAGAVPRRRLDRLMRDACDRAAARLGEREAAAGHAGYIQALVEEDRLTTRLLLNALVHGDVLFFADCLAHLAKVPRGKVFTLLDTGSRAGLNALFARCGFSAPLRNVMARLVFHARVADLAEDLAARHYVVTALLEELMAEHADAIPASLDEAFAYLNEQNIALARAAARGVMVAFATEVPDVVMVADARDAPPLALPAA